MVTTWRLRGEQVEIRLVQFSSKTRPLAVCLGIACVQVERGTFRI